MADVILINPAFESLSVNPKHYKDHVFREPTNLLYLGSVLDNEGYNVKIIDVCPYHVEGNNSFLKVLKKEADNALLVGITALTEQIKQGIELSEFAKKINPNLKIVWGGVHPSLFPSQTCIDPLIDFVVVGEGETTLLELTNALEKDNSDFSGIDGLVYKENGNVKINNPRKLLDMNELPSPNWDLVEVDRYITMPDGRKEMQVHTSRGCPHRCTFCINRIFENLRWRSKNAEKVLDEIEYLINRYNVDHIRFRDENFSVNKKRVDEIAEGILKRKFDITWRMSARCDYFKRGFIDENNLGRWVKSGLEQIDTGAESGSDRVLKILKKDLTPQDILNAARMINKFDLKSTFSFMIGLPGETREDMEKTVDIIFKIKEINPKKMRILGPQIFRPYPGGELYNTCKRLGLKEPDNLRGWISLDPLHAVGYTSLQELPWIEDRRYVYFISRNMPYLVYNWHELRTYSWTGFRPATKRAIFGVIQKLRHKTNFLYFLYEEQLYYKMLRVINRLSSSS